MKFTNHVKHEPFIFKLIQEYLPQEDTSTEEAKPIRDTLAYLLMVLLGAVIVVYAYCTGLFSSE